MEHILLSTAHIRRRAILGFGAGVFVGASILGIFPPSASAQQMNERDFLALSQRLTGRPLLDPTIAARAFAALSAEDRMFPALAFELSAALDKAGLTDMRQFKQFASDHPDLSPTAMKIISAWYLGYTGTPEGEANHDDPRFVSYAGALMYEPTKDVTIVPTYARGHTNYWVEPPASLEAD